MPPAGTLLAHEFLHEITCWQSFVWPRSDELYVQFRNVLEYPNPFFLYHIYLPAILIFVVYRLGYHRKAWIAQTMLIRVVLPLCYWFTDPRANINCVRVWRRTATKAPRPRKPIIVDDNVTITGLYPLTPHTL